MKKKLTKLAIKKVTLRDLDLDAIAGGTTGHTCDLATCVSACYILCKESRASCDGTCFGTACI